MANDSWDAPSYRYPAGAARRRSGRLCAGQGAGSIADSRSNAPAVILARGRRVPRRGADRRQLAVVGPWVVRNAIELDGPTVLTKAGVTLSGSDCDDGRRFGAFQLTCAVEANAPTRSLGRPGPEMLRLARHAPDYARHILGSYPSSRRHESGGCGASTTSEGSSHSKSPERHERGWKKRHE